MSRFFFVLVVATAVAVSPSLPAQASSADIDLVVTADRILTEIVSTAGNITVITADQIRESGATNLVELLGRQSGVTFRSFSNEAQAELDMRGFGEGSAGRVLILVNGRRQNNPDMSGINWLSIPVDSIERIEVLRGSASALYGNHAVAGVINIITREATNPLEITAFGSFGSFMSHQERVGIRHAGDRYRVQASAEHFSTEGHRDRSGYRALNFGLGIGLDANEHIALSVGGRYATVSYELPGGLAKQQFEQDPSQAGNPADDATENQFVVDADIEWRLGDQTRIEIPLGYSLKMLERDTVSFFSFTNTDLHSFTASPAVVLDWDFGTVPVRTRLGLDGSWARQDGRRFSDVERDTQSDGFTLGQLTLGGSIANTVYIGEQIDLSTAARYDRAVASALKDASDIDDSKTHHAVVFDLGTVYRPVEFAKTFVSGGTLFRYPSIDEQASVQGFGDQFENELDPERGFTIEAGAGFYLGRKVRLDASLFWLQMRDEIAFVGGFGAGGRNTNIDETRRIGGELQVVLEPFDQLRLSAGYRYVDAVFIKGDDRGKKIPLVADHELDADLAIRLLPGVQFGPAITYRSEAFQSHWNDPYSADKIDAYFVTDFFLRVQPSAVPGNLALSAELTNVFDRNYAQLVVSDSYYPAPGRGFRLAAAFSY
ncbi:MAG: TonB-dependent receptor [Spirochaetaceae bacterium]|nr:MAG: TonB-dependent receptor [Spirochaetaceae bacterium]